MSKQSPHAGFQVWHPVVKHVRLCRKPVFLAIHRVPMSNNAAIAVVK